MYTIKKVAELLEMTEYTIRFYSDKDLIPTLKRDKNNNRIFDESDLNWLIVIKYLRSTGMTIIDIKEYITLCMQGANTINQRHEIMLRQQKKAEETLKEAKRATDFINHKVKIYEDLMSNSEKDLTNPANWPDSNLDWFKDNIAKFDI